MMLMGKIQELYSNKTIVNGALFSLFSFINRGIGFVLLLILAKYIQPEDYGYLGLFGTVIMFLGYFTALSTEGYLSVSYFKEGEQGLERTLSSIFVLSILVTFFWLCLLLGGGEFFSDLLSLPVDSLYVALFVSLFTLLVNVYLDYYRIKEKVKVYGFISCSNAVLNFVVSIIFVDILLWGWKGRVYAQFFCYAIFGLFSIWYFFKNRYIVVPSKEQIKKMLIWGLPLIPHQAASFFRGGCDTYIIKYFYAIEDVGLFGFANTLATVIFMLGMGFNQSNSVEIYKTLGSKSIINTEKERRLKKQRLLYWGLYLGFTVVYTLSAFVAIPFLLPKYVDSLKYLPFLSIYNFLICVYLIYTNYLFFYNKTKEIMYVTFCSALLHLVLSLLFTRFSLYITGCIYIFTQFIVVVFIRSRALSCLKRSLSI